MATSTEPGGEITPSLDERFVQQASSLPQQGMLHVNVALNDALVEHADMLEITFTLVSPLAVDAELSITPDFPGDTFDARVGNGSEGCLGCGTEIVERGGGIASTSSRDGWNSVEYVLSFARKATSCAGEVRSKGSCAPARALSDVCPGAAACTLGFTLERMDSSETSDEPTSVAVTARAVTGINSSESSSEHEATPAFNLRVGFDD